LYKKYSLKRKVIPASKKEKEETLDCKDKMEDKVDERDLEARDDLEKENDILNFSSEKSSYLREEQVEESNEIVEKS
jgi:hypothetical protein